MTLSRRCVSVAVFCAAVCVSAGAGAVETSLSTKFPGGNIRVIRNLGSTVELAPDLRDSASWFYWQFDAAVDQPGRVQFVFSNAPALSVQGPAISRDEGKTWQWLGTGSVQFASASSADPAERTTDSFRYDFTNAGQKVRFCVAVPYLARDLDEFLAVQQANPHLSVGVLTKTRKGRPVTLLQVGNPGPGIQAVLVTARHHACESMASYVLEGFLKEALSDSPAGAAFRQRYVLYAVPMVDVDGVQEGDQGKGRRPHDHNRDYGWRSRYPEVQAIQQLARRKRVELALDFHCPLIRGESHTVFYFDGLAVPPTDANARELTAWMDEEVPPVLLRGPLPWMKARPASMSRSGLPFSHYFALQSQVRMAVTLETPYALQNSSFDAAMAREYGAALLRAWVRTEFTAAGQPRKASHEDFLKMQKTLQGLVRPKPQDAERTACGYLADTNAPDLYRIEARRQLGVLRARQQRFPEALLEFTAVATNPAATTAQRADALTQRALAVCSGTASNEALVEQTLGDFLRMRHTLAEQRAQVHGAVGAFYERLGRLDLALTHAQAQLAVASPHTRGRVSNWVASLYDRLGEPGKAIECRQEAVVHLRRLLNPVPVGVYGPMMAADLFDALKGIPTSTEAERQEAASIVLNHPVKNSELIRRVSPPQPAARN